ncbi:MAG: glycosyltransferase family 39 protein [Chloroflexota bacterium]
MSLRRFLLLILLLGAFALRVFRLEAQSLWWDEGISLHLATSTVPEIFADRLDNIHPPLYFVLLKGWLKLVGVGAFNGRYLSTLFSLLQIPILYAVSRRWFKGSKWATETAVFLLTISPIAIIYAQETRVYALLPVFYLGLLGVAYELRRQPTMRLWVVFGILQWIVIHLHYVAAFALILINLWLIFPWIVTRFIADRSRIIDSTKTRQIWAKHWLMTNLIAGGLSLPWFMAVLLNFTAVRDHAELGTYTTEATPIPFLISQVWGFHLTGLPAAFGDPLIRVGLVIAAFLLLGFLLLALWQAPKRKTILLLLAAWLLPVMTAFALWSVRSFAHPRYVIMYAVILLPLVAYIGVSEDAHAKAQRRKGVLQSITQYAIRITHLTLLFLLLLLSAWGVSRYFFDETIAKDDVRGAARYLGAMAQPDDLIVIPDTDWSMPFEFRGETPVVMLNLANREEMWTNLAAWTRAGQTVFVFDYERGTYDFQAVGPYLFEEAGLLREERAFNNVFIRSYELDKRVELSNRQEANGRFAPFTLQSTSIAPATTDSAVTVVLQWHVTAPTTQRLNVALRLQEETGWVRGTSDRLLLDENGRPTEQWQVGDEPITYHVIPIQPGTPPLAYDVLAAVYEATEAGVQPLDLLDVQGAPQGQQLLLGLVQLEVDDNNDLSGYGLDYPVAAWEEPRTLPSGLALAGADVGVETAVPGQSIQVLLRWQAGDAVQGESPQLVLLQDGEMLVAETAVFPDYPPAQWQPDETLIMVQRLRVPPMAQDTVQLAIQHGDVTIPLNTLTIETSDHLFVAPQPTYPLDIVFGDVARLIGYDLEGNTFSNGEAVPLTLYWESLATGISTNYTVFAHILAADGHLIGQHDAPPVNGSRPTMGWVANEFVVDPHEMVFREAYSGKATIEVGLYDPLTNGRLATESGQDFIYLPLELTVTAP